MQTRLIPDHRVRLAVGALVFASGLSLSMLAARTYFAEQPQLLFYIWNLFLAWLPLLFALRFYRLDAAHSPQWTSLTVWAGSWFLFFPNAPYIVTDLLHFDERPPIPIWFDLIMMVSFAWTGLLLGYLSLFLMQEVVRRRRGAAWSWSFVSVMLMLTSFGIYLGRFQRWNSWDVLTRPFGLAADVIARMNFLRYPQMSAFCVTFFAFSLLSYATIYTLTHLHNNTAPADKASSNQ